MVWPCNTPKVVPLAGAVQVMAPMIAGLPSVVITATSVCLFDNQHHVVIATHARSEESLEKYGNNLYFKLNYDQDIIGIATDKGYLLIYSIIHNDDELLSTYNKTSELLQNGLVLNKQLSFFEKLHIENPIPSYQLRFKIFLKIHHDLKDFQLLKKFELLLITSKNIQLIDLHTSNDEIINIKSDQIIKMSHSQPLTKSDQALFFLINEHNTGKLFIKNSKEFKLFNDFAIEDIIDASVNLKLGLILLLHKDKKKVSFYNYNLKLIVKELVYDDSIKKLNWLMNNNSYSILFENETWAINSIFGSNFFKSSDNDVDSCWLNKVINFDILMDQSYIILTDSVNLYIVSLLTNLNINNKINYNLKRPILVTNGEVHIYSAYENKTSNWNIIRLPFEEYHQILQIYQASLSNDYNYLALSNNKSLLIHSLVADDWSFYINDYNHDMYIENLTWFSKLNLLLVTNKTSVQSELIIFDFKNFDNEVTFDSNLIKFKYDFNSNIKIFNVIDEDILIMTENLKYYHFKIELLKNKGIKIDLIKIISFEKIFESLDFVQNVFKINSDSEDLLIQENNEILYLKNKNNSFEKFLLFDKVEYISRIDVDNYYLFNGDSLIMIKDLTNLIENIDSKETINNSILKISTLKKNYPILLNLNNGLFVTLENDIISKKSIQINNVLTENSIFLHDLIKFEMKNSDDIKLIFTKYSKFKNFQYSLELLLYQTIDNEHEIPEKKLIELIKFNPIYELNIVSKCLRKIELEHWDKLFKNLNLTSDELINRSIELKQFHTLSILIIIFLNYNDNNSKSNKNTENTINDYDENRLLEILKLIYINAQDEELWDSCFELLRFFKILDTTGDLLNKSIKMLESI